MRILDENDPIEVDEIVQKLFEEGIVDVEGANRFTKPLLIATHNNGDTVKSHLGQLSLFLIFP
jgi:hypothetical protein